MVLHLTGHVGVALRSAIALRRHLERLGVELDVAEALQEGDVGGEVERDRSLERAAHFIEAVLPAAARILAQALEDEDAVLDELIAADLHDTPGCRAWA